MQRCAGLDPLTVKESNGSERGVATPMTSSWVRTPLVLNPSNLSHRADAG
jgi:hypothetical protein